MHDWADQHVPAQLQKVSMGTKDWYTEHDASSSDMMRMWLCKATVASGGTFELL